MFMQHPSQPLQIYIIQDIGLENAGPLSGLKLKYEISIYLHVLSNVMPVSHAKHGSSIYFRQNPQW